jgi:repressor LexA
MDRLTERQGAVLERIRAFFEERGVSPTLRELAGALGLDPKSVAQHLDRLERKGFISRRPRESRNIRLEGAARPARGLPLVGRIAAGPPGLAEENLEGRVEVEAFFGPKEEHFLLRVQGDSMKGAGIRDGDLVAVRSGGRVRDGDIAVAVVEGEATVKRLYRQGKFLKLEPESPGYETLIVNMESEEVRIVGPVKGLIRRM